MNGPQLLHSRIQLPPSSDYATKVRMGAHARQQAHTKDEGTTRELQALQGPVVRNRTQASSSGQQAQRLERNGPVGAQELPPLTRGSGWGTTMPKLAPQAPVARIRAEVAACVLHVLLRKSCRCGFLGMMLQSLRVGRADLLPFKGIVNAQKSTDCYFTEPAILSARLHCCMVLKFRSREATGSGLRTHSEQRHCLPLELPGCAGASSPRGRKSSSDIAASLRVLKSCALPAGSQ